MTSKKTPSPTPSPASNIPADPGQLDRTQRKEDAARILAAAETYAADHNGTYPTPSEAREALTPLLTPPLIESTTNKPYLIQPDPPTLPHHMQYSTHATCTDNNDGLKAAPSPRQIALRFLDDTTTYYCISNSESPFTTPL
jgi:hypothetical protein